MQKLHPYLPFYSIFAGFHKVSQLQSLLDFLEKDLNSRLALYGSQIDEAAPKSYYWKEKPFV